MDYLKVIDMQLWSELFGICLMFGIDEDVYKANYEALFYEETYKEIRIRKKQLKADAVAGVIPYKSIEGEFYYKPRKLIEWAIFRGLPVPDDFRLGLDNFKQISDIVRLELEKHEPQAETLGNVGAGSLIRVWCFRIGYMIQDISETIGTEPMDINWRHWLSLPLWSKKEAVLLISGLNPNKFYEIERHENYQSMCEPFIELCQRTSEESGTPYYWLNKFNKDGYLDCPPRGVREWLAQQIEHTQLEPQAKAVDVGAGSQATTERKKLKPKERDTNEGLLLVYEMFHQYDVKYLDQLPAAQAWGKIVSGEFTSDLINSVSENKKNITLNGGEKLSKEDFSDKYRRRFIK